ncbi:MAG: rRNA pseudouridine synthase [Treponema sp.]|nr:rRNA pseudouridine synthase [Treponema sp.]
MNSREKNDGQAPASQGVRLQVYLAHAGLASRRGAEKLISAGRVQVNGEVISVLGEKVTAADRVLLDGRPVRPESRFRYLALHKPPGYICSSYDPQGRPLALKLLPPEIGERLYSIGRLDLASSGLILFTNDGDFAAAVSHPSSGIEKEYLVEASGPIPDSVVSAFAGGLVVEGRRYRARKIEKTGPKSLRVCLVEGKNREIRRVFSHFHLHPLRLHRVRIGPVPLGDLAPGESRPLEAAEIQALLGGSPWSSP